MSRLRYYPMITVDKKRCFSYIQAQKEFERVKKEKKKECVIEIYKTKHDLKPMHIFVLHLDKITLPNLFLYIVYVINQELELLIKMVNDEELDKRKKKEYEDEIYRLRKYQEEAEEWYIEFVIENEKNKDIWLSSLLTDPYEFENSQYYSYADIVYMTWNLALMNRADGVYSQEFFQEFEETSNMDINILAHEYEICCKEHRISFDFHQEKVDIYVKQFEDNPYIRNRILKNNNVYRNLHSTKKLHKQKNMI